MLISYLIVIKVPSLEPNVKSRVNDLDLELPMSDKTNCGNGHLRQVNQLIVNFLFFLIHLIFFYENTYGSNITDRVLYGNERK